jgi:hypothetical protein
MVEMFLGAREKVECTLIGKGSQSQNQSSAKDQVKARGEARTQELWRLLIGKCAGQRKVKWGQSRKDNDLRGWLAVCCHQCWPQRADRFGYIEMYNP